MILRSLFPRPGRSLTSTLRFTLRLLAIFICLEATYIAVHNPPYVRVPPGSPQDPASTAAAAKPRIFIASIHRNNEAVLRSHWNSGLLSLIRHFGAQNVFVSLYESGSIDATKDVLRQLDAQLEELRVPRSVVIDDHDQIEEVERRLSAKEPGWVWTSNARFELRRIPYLAALRNGVMGKLHELREAGETYDYVLWLNDVVFTVEDVLTLMATRDGAWDSVCAMDFSVASIYYDTFALRDAAGAKAEPQGWPYFLDARSRRAVREKAPVPVRSCWNGVVVFKAEAFYGRDGREGLRFRGIEDGLAEYHLEGSECCLVHADNTARLEEGGGGEGVWLNPNVRVGYNPEAYVAVNPGGGRGKWPAGLRRVRGVWENRMGRAFVWPRRWMERREVRGRVAEWERKGEEGQERRETGEWCLINEMQVLAGAGWVHV